VIEGEVYVLTAFSLDEQKIHEISRLSDDKTLVSMRHAFPVCGPSGGKKQAPFILDLFTDYDSYKEMLSIYQPKTGSLSILEGDLFIHTVQDYFTWDDGWGLMDAAQIRLGLTPGSVETTTVFKDGGDQWTARAHKDMVIWVDWSSYPLKIRRWTKELGAGVLFQAPDYDIRPALSDTVVAWVGGHRDPEIAYIHIATELYWAPWNTTSLVPVKGPDITGMSSRDVELIAGDDYLALFGGEPDAGNVGIIVVQMSTQKRWYLYAPENHMLLPRAISKTELLVQELGPQPKMEFLNYRRYDLSRLDESSGPWPGPP
jgi:hypothetical protein